MTDSQYLGPRVDAHRLRTATRDRVERYVAKRATELHRDAVARWAGEDDTPYPSFVEARRSAEYETETLLRALGPWGGVPDHVIPFRPRRPPGLPGWLHGDDLEY